MKSNLLTLLLGLFLASGLFAQTFEFTNDGDTIVFDWDGTNQDVVNKGFTTNMLSDTNALKWTKTELSMPDGWASAICDKNLCYLDFVRSQEFELFPNEVGRLDLHLYTYSNPGHGDTAVVEVCVEELAAPNHKSCLTYMYIARGNSSTSNPADIETSISVSPNPTSDFFSIQGVDRAGRVEVYNMIGSKMKQFNGQYESTFGVADLPSGIYFVRVYDESNARVLSTVRLKKN